MCLEINRLKREAKDNGHQLAKVANTRYECVNCGAELNQSNPFDPQSWSSTKTGSLCRLSQVNQTQGAEETSETMPTQEAG